MLRLGLCCIFRHKPIKFRTTTAMSLRNMSRQNALNKISELCIHNALSLNDALAYCNNHRIGAFRISSGILPLRTHPHLGYAIDELPGATQIRALFSKCHKFAQNNNIRTTFHPDQFVVLNSPRLGVVDSSITELEHHGEMNCLPADAAAQIEHHRRGRQIATESKGLCSAGAVDRPLPGERLV